MDLNKTIIKNADGEDVIFQNYNNVSADGKISVYFKNIEQELIKKIDEADIVIGSVAWMTNKPILNALSQKIATAIVVQKEDFLRPDINISIPINNTTWKMNLKNLYSRLPRKLTRYADGWKGTVLHNMSCCGDPYIDSVRCVGNLNSEKVSAFPRAHNKFVLFCKKNDNDYKQWLNFKPYEVWTGSFNFTQNSTKSLENVVSIKDEIIVNSYLKELAQILAISEELDWKSEWMSPDWRIGT